MAFRIYPSIGIARVGNDPTQFYIAPEIPGHPGFDVGQQGNETRIAHYKADEDQIKRQAARFRLFEVPDGGGTPREAQLPAGATVEWTVHLVNKKAAVVRPNEPPNPAIRPRSVANPAPVLIDPGARSISGASASGVKFDSGDVPRRRRAIRRAAHRQESEPARARRLRLLVLAGNAPLTESMPMTAGMTTRPTDRSQLAFASRTAAGSTISLRHGSSSTPDFAPRSRDESLYDIMLQVESTASACPRRCRISFARDVFPLLSADAPTAMGRYESGLEQRRAMIRRTDRPFREAAQLRARNANFVRARASRYCSTST